jgi:hypothetical protein
MNRTILFLTIIHFCFVSPSNINAQLHKRQQLLQQVPLANELRSQPSVGLNKFDLFLQYLGTASGGDGSLAYRKVTQAKAKKAIIDAKNIGVTYFRISVTGYGPDVHNSPGDLDLWRENPTEYWNLFHEMIKDLNAYKMRFIPVFIWNQRQFPAMTSETVFKMMSDPDSDSYRLLTSYIADFISRYKSHPMLYFYELTNEMSLGSDLDLVSRCLQGPYLDICPTEGNYSTDLMIAFTSRLAGYVRSLDPNHLISSGFAIPRTNAEHLRRQPEWSPNGADWTLDSLDEFRKNLADIHEGIDIVSVHFYNGSGDNERFGITGKTNAEFLDIIKNTTDAMRKQLFVGEFGDSDPNINEDPNALFTQNTLKKIAQLKIPYSAPWVWEFYHFATYHDNSNGPYNLEPGYTDLLIARIKEANKKLGNSVPSQQVPDTTKPQVILTWPLEGSRMSDNQLINAVASDNNGTISKVDFWVDGKLKATITKPPYQFHLDTTILPSGESQITVIAFDPSGNQSQYSTTVMK